MKILIVDDHSLFRAGIRHVLHELDDEVIVYEASDYSCALQQVENNPDLDMVLLDLELPEKNGFVTLGEITRDYPMTPVVIVSGSNRPGDMQTALDSGAVGYITKESTSSVMINALRLVLAGGIYLPPDMLIARRESGESAMSSELTKRQLQVLSLLAEGFCNKDIALKMSLAESTVKMHISAIFRILKVNNRTQAANAFEKLGYKNSLM